MSTTVSASKARLDDAAGSSSAWAGRSDAGKSRARWRVGGRWKRVPYLLLGLVLVVGCAVAAVVVVQRLDDRQSVLVLARPVTVGHVLSMQDLSHVAVPVDEDRLGGVPVTEASAVVDRPMAYSLPAGTVVTRDSVGVPAIPPEGLAVTAIGVSDGQLPPLVGAGAQVVVVLSDSPDPTGASGGSSVGAPVAQWAATVVEVAAGVSEQSLVVSLQLPEDQARELAAAPADRVRLVMVGGGGR